MHIAEKIQWLTKPFQCSALLHKWLNTGWGKLYKVIGLFVKVSICLGYSPSKFGVDRTLSDGDIALQVRATHWKGFVTFVF